MTAFNSEEKRKAAREDIAKTFKAPDYAAKFREIGRKILGGPSEAKADSPEAEAVRRMRKGGM